MMTKKHFKAIAKILNSVTADYSIITRFADFLETENPRFDRNKFVDACVETIEAPVKQELCEAEIKATETKQKTFYFSIDFDQAGFEASTAIEAMHAAITAIEDGAYSIHLTD